ncbi:MAG: glycosyltransferase family 39 protein [Myxococcota bacterium]|nr:glycosyltransferase family 39 protein [Myxococcota bacterium]
MSERDDEASGGPGPAEDSPSGEPPRKGRKGSKKKGSEPPASIAGEVIAARAAAPQRRGSRWSPGTHHARGGVIFVVGLLSTFALMANHDQLHLGPLFGILTTLLTTIGLLDLLGLLSASAWSPAERSAAVSFEGATALWDRDREPIFMAPIVTVPLAILVLLIGLAAGGVDGLPLTIVVGLLVLALSAMRRPGMLVFVVAAAIILPFLGAYGLWDPWETHYGEVAREILARDDWISLWWAQEDWFWSKPIFIFWIESLSMGALGVDFQPDAHPAHPEWAIRLPHFLLAMGALLAIYAVVQRSFGKRAGVIAALVLCTMPHFFLLSHQSITDMPFVSTMTMAICMLGLAISETSDREVRRYRLGPVMLSAQHAVIGLFGMACVPQIMLLLTRNVTLVTGGFAWHRDRFMFGSAGNAGNPGNAEPREVGPAFDAIAAQPFVQGLIWLAGLAAIVWLLRRERRAQTLYMFAFYFFCALSFMSKGIPGFALPGMVAMFWLIASRRWDLLLEGKLRVATGMLVIATVGLPWYVAMYIRHGQGFTDRLLVHDHINRLTAGVHGDTGSAEYFFEQLGYGLFPWIALAPIAIAGWILLGARRPSAPAVSPAAEGATAELGTAELAAAEVAAIEAAAPDGAASTDRPAADRRRELLLLVGLWGTSAFVLFSAMTTKFHHYIFPAVPAAGVLVGLAFDRLLGPRNDLDRASPQSVAGTLLAVIAPVPAIVGVAGIWGDVRGVVPEGVDSSHMRDWVLMNPWYAQHTLALIALGAVLAAGAWYLLRGEPKAVSSEDGAARWVPAAATAGLFAAPAIVALVGRDLSWVTSARPHGYERLIHLFVYNYQRPWPEYLDYRPVLTGFAIVAALAIGIAALPAARQVALRAFLGVAMAFAVWCLDVYLIDLSPHWGQRELIDRYYEERGGPDEALIAWQMNWKGENFYTGNAVLAFVDLDNRRLQEWVREHPGQRAYFLLEHARLANLRSVLRGATVEEVTDDRLDNKFILVSADLPGPTPTPQDTRD